MVRSKLDEHRLKDVSVEDVLAGQTFQAGPFSIEMVKMAHSIPDAFAVALTCELGTTLMTGPLFAWLERRRLAEPPRRQVALGESV